MNELIKISDVVYIIQNTTCDYPTWSHFVLAKEKMIWNIRNAPTVEAVEVVRCKDCEAYQQTEGGKPFCVVHEIAICENDFCSFGKKTSV